MKYALLIASVVAMLSAHPAEANDDRPTPDVIACLKGVQPFDLRYRTRMEIACLSHAAEVCVIIDDGGGPCVADLLDAIRAFYENLSPRLPTTIEGFHAGGYRRALERAAEAFDTLSECAGLEGEEYAACAYLQLGTVTIDLLYRARQAEVSLP